MRESRNSRRTVLPNPPGIWDYSVEGSLPTLNALMTYLDEQKLSHRKMKIDELFVPNISPGLIDYLRATGEG